MIDDGGDYKENDTCDVIGHEQLSGFRFMKGRKLTLVERKYPLKRKKSGTWKVNTNRSALTIPKCPAMMQSMANPLAISI